VRRILIADDEVKIVKGYRPDLILMDVQVPEIDGIEAFEILQTDPMTMNIPVIALTSYAMRGDREKLLSIGVRDHIAKPISINDFLELVEYYGS
jgi:CheY-like chemotaxis protein